MGLMVLLSPQPKARMHSLQRCDAVLLGNHTAGANFTGGDQPDVDSRIRQGSEHPAGGSWCCGHTGADGTDAGDGIAFLQCCAGPLSQQWRQCHIGAAAVLLAQDEADVAGAVAVLPLGLNDGIKTDAPFRQGAAERSSGARAVGNVTHRQLGLISPTRFSTP